MWTLGEVNRLPLMEPVDVGPYGMQAWYWSENGLLPNGQSAPQTGEWEQYSPRTTGFVGEGFRTRFSAIDMLSCIPSCTTHIHRVSVDGTVVPTYKVMSATKIMVEWSVPAEPVLSAFARWCALLVALVWVGRRGVPRAAIDFLRTGYEPIRPQAAEEVVDLKLGVPTHVDGVMDCRLAAKYAIRSDAAEAAARASWHASRSAKSSYRAARVMNEKLEQILNEYNEGRRAWVWNSLSEREWYDWRYTSIRSEYAK